ncbi:heavy-metal-associated domain-containing protein [Actinoplanes couchii]|uniref:Heavy metal transport/detoxification protein n=1 Tax=Actinoplanes couchii TaxID=403638 RepID=A0ABQ3XFM6_9ACTN|nr:heavy-metal-associated domain-containing protein [Actinoplanes couchii]MDR6321744.1 copper chaperone CopZ [Actinoplanes couchii]GID57299.1 heavy metal transport/detoxification protein [Actinoplanes couchii]
MQTTTYPVTGMTCSHCVDSVTTEISAIPGVTDVAVDLAGGTVTVVSEAPVDRETVRAAVDEAGYELGDAS